jgi:hypothetical protein
MPQKQASCKKQAHVQTLKFYVNCWQVYPQESLPCPSGESPLLKQTEQFTRSVHYSHIIYRYKTAALF